MERMRAELSRARRRGSHVLMPEEVPSPMDLNATLEVAAALIADCARQADRRSSPAAARGEPTVFDEGALQAALGAATWRGRPETA